MSITCREKLEMDHPEFIDEKWAGGCKDCPGTYGYRDEMLDGLCDCKTCNNDICTKCWDQPYEGELTPLEKKYFALKDENEAHKKARESYFKLFEEIDELYRSSRKCGSDTYYIPCIIDPFHRALHKLSAVEHTLHDIHTAKTLKAVGYNNMLDSRNRWRAAWIGLLAGNIIACILGFIL